MKTSRANQQPILSSTRFSTILVVATFLLAALIAPTAFMQEGAPQQAAVKGRASLRTNASDINAADMKADGRAKQADSSTTDAGPLSPDAANNYTFATNTSGTFTSMSSGTTQLVTALQDDTSSAVTNIGFDFYLLGVRYSQFSVSSNGYVRLGATAVSTSQYTLGTAGATLLTAYGSDLVTSTTGKVHYKVTGSAPNRVLTIEFLDQTIIYDGAGATADGTNQVRLYESTGVVEFVYGGMNRNASTGFGGGMDAQYVGFSTNSTANTYATVTTATNVANTTVAPASNQPPLNTPIANINTPVDGSRRTYSFTPTVPTAPTALNFTAVTKVGMTLNWTDSPNELIYAVYRSTDGINYAFDGTAALNATSYAATNLAPGTNYFWQVYAVSDGALSTALSGSQATAAPGVFTSAGTGLWSAPATWGGSVPTNGDLVTIADGTTVTIDTAAAAYTVTVGQGASGILQYQDTATARSLTVTNNMTVAAGGTFRANPTATVSGTHSLSIGQDLVNNGTMNMNMVTGAFTSAVTITFTGASDAAFTLNTGSTTNFRQTAGVTVNKGTSQIAILTFTPGGTITVIGANAVGFLTITNGTFKLAGTNAFSNPLFNVAAYAIPSSAGFWLSNASATVVGLTGSPLMNGLLRITSGTFNVGTASGNSIEASVSGSTFLIEGGVVNVAGRLGSGSTARATTYNQSGGAVNLSTAGNASGTVASFTTGNGSSLIMSGGTVTLVQINSNATPTSRQDWVSFGSASITGGLLTFGTGATTGNTGDFTYRMRGLVPAFAIDNTTNAKRVSLILQQANVLGNITINTGTTLDSNGLLILFAGTSVTNNGAIVGTLAGSEFLFTNDVAQTYSGTGTFGTTGAPFIGFGAEIANPAGVTLNAPIVTTRVDLFEGTFINSNQITLGNAGASATTVQIGQTGGTTPGGSFDVSPIHNAGTGGHTIFYLQESVGRTTGFEIPPSRIIANTTINNTNGVTLAGGNLTVNLVTTLTNGRVVTGANTQIVGSGGTVTRTNGYVDGNFRKTYTVAGSKVFEVGTANGYSPATVNATAGTFPSDFTVKATQGPQPNVNPGTSLQRYWTLTEGGSVTANLQFNYNDPPDVMGIEANYRLIRVIGGIPFSFPNNCPTPAAGQACVDTTANTATTPGVTEFSDWTVGEITSPTAAPATISGQVTTTSGAPMAGVTMFLSGTRSGRAVTDANGIYRFANMPTGDFYTLTPSITNYHFSPASRSFALLANVTDGTFTGTPDAVSSGNVIDSPEYFVRQHYLDFLGREPDYAGLNFWSDQMRGCSNDYTCLERRTINVSAAYFLSIEFQETGGLVDGLYRASYGRAPRFAEFMPDRATVAHDVIVGEAGWQNTLRANKEAFLNAWVERAAFRAAYDQLSNDGYVDALVSNTRVTFTDAERATLVGGLANGTLTRAQALQRVAENESFTRAKFNEAFVRMEYFGYLRRDPDDSGFHFWLNKLNEFEGNFERAEMVKAFLVSSEYRDRFRQQ